MEYFPHDFTPILTQMENQGVIKVVINSVYSVGATLSKTLITVLVGRYGLISARRTISVEYLDIVVNL